MISMKEILHEKKDWVWPLLQSILVFIGSIVLFRLVFYFYASQSLVFGKPQQPLDKESIFIAALEIGLVAAIAMIFRFSRMHRLLMLKEKDLVRDKLETELKFLRNQVNPHFLFNTLNNIYALARRKSDDTADVIVKLSKLLRFMLYESKNKLVSIQDEVKMLEDYIELEKIRYSNRLSVSFICEIDDDKETLAPLLLITFVENAFKHGVGKSRFESYIHMELKLRNKMLSFCIENSKESLLYSSTRENIGLTNVRRQLELMYGDHDLTFQDEELHFKVDLKINLESYASL